MVFLVVAARHSDSFSPNSFISAKTTLTIDYGIRLACCLVVAVRHSHIRAPTASNETLRTKDEKGTVCFETSLKRFV
jgi:hypothetical protein